MMVVIAVSLIVVWAVTVAIIIMKVALRWSITIAVIVVRVVIIIRVVIIRVVVILDDNFFMVVIFAVFGEVAIGISEHHCTDTHCEGGE